MSWAATAYVKKLRVDKNGKKLTKGHKLVLFVLADYHNEERGDTWTSLRRMAIESLYSLSGLIVALRALENGGVIRVVRDKNAVKNRITNRYLFPDLDTIADIETGAPLLKKLEHIFPKNLSNQSIQIQEKSVAKEHLVDNSVDTEKESKQFKEFSRTYPHRGGKQLEQVATKAIFYRLSPDDQAIVVKAAAHYAAAMKDQGLLAKNQQRFLLDSSGHEPWRDWIEPARPLLTQRPPPMPPKTDPIARGHWNRIYGHQK